MVVLTLSAYAAAFVWRHHPWSTRVVPSKLARVGVGVVFAAWVDPAFGILAALAGFWWLTLDFEWMPGGTLWPLIAMTVWMGQASPLWCVHLALSLWLAMGVLQSLISVTQRYPRLARINVFPSAWPHGTIGHRTGLGIYLATLLPLGFLTDYGWWLALLYVPGLVLARSAVALGSALVGLLWVTGAWWAIPLIAILGVPRALKWHYGPVPSRASEWVYLGPLAVKFRHLPQSLMARTKVWRVALWHSMLSPHWVIGHGGLSFHRASRSWIGPHGFLEHYDEAHNDYVEFFYEYGAVGLAAAAFWIGWHWQAFARGEPVTGALLAFATAMLANFPARVATLTALFVFLLILVMR